MKTVYIAIGLFFYRELHWNCSTQRVRNSARVVGKNYVCAHAREKLNCFELLYRTMYVYIVFFFNLVRRAIKKTFLWFNIFILPRLVFFIYLCLQRKQTLFPLMFRSSHMQTKENFSAIRVVSYPDPTQGSGDIRPFPWLCCVSIHVICDCLRRCRSLGSMSLIYLS